MSGTSAQPPGEGAGCAAGPRLVLDQFMPAYDLSIVHADVFRAPPSECCEMVLGQVSRPWKSVAASADAPTTRGQFTGIDEPGYAKIAAGLRIDPYGAGSSILTVETRVAITDETSLRRFRRYWALIGPFSFLIRRMALRQLAVELRRPGRQDHRGAA